MYIYIFIECVQCKQDKINQGQCSPTDQDTGPQSGGRWSWLFCKEFCYKKQKKMTQTQTTALPMWWIFSRFCLAKCSGNFQGFVHILFSSLFIIPQMKRLYLVWSTREWRLFDFGDFDSFLSLSNVKCYQNPSKRSVLPALVWNLYSENNCECPITALYTGNEHSSCVEKTNCTWKSYSFWE